MKQNDVEQMEYIHTTSLSSFLFVLYTEMFKSDGFSNITSELQAKLQAGREEI